MSATVGAQRNPLLAALGLGPEILRGQTALVTGAARGIGEHTARALAALGAKVLLVDVNPQGVSVARHIQDAGGAAAFLHADLGDIAALPSRIADWRAQHGPIDILVNNAAQIVFGPVLEQTPEAWGAHLNANLLGPVTLIQTLAPEMIARGRGVILSLISLEGMALMGAYCASKMALRSLMLSLGKEIPPGAGVSVLSVIPGAVETPLAQEMIGVFAARFGVPAAEVRASMANNPGYSGLVPVEHTAASLGWFCVHAARYHGQYVDGYLPLSQAGVIDAGDGGAAEATPPQAPGVIPNPGLELKQLIDINRSLEARIQERTRELKEANSRLQKASWTDPLTGLWNRRYAEIAIVDDSDLASRAGDGDASRVQLVVIDVDDFKTINDTYGHLCGDIVLKDMAKLLTSQTRGSDRVMRWGGEEFLIVARGLAAEQIVTLVERIRRTVASHSFARERGGLACTCSLGFVSVPHSAPAGHLPWVSSADLCMYAAKKAGRNRWSGLEIHADAVEPLLAAPAGGAIAARAQQGHVNLFSSDDSARRALLEAQLPRLSPDH